MPTEQTRTQPNWKLLPGTILDGGYEMEELLEADERRAKFKIRVLGDRTIDAFASFFPLGGAEAAEQVEAWDFLRRVPHPNLSKPLSAGRRELEGSEVLYVVLRKPDESLNGVLTERALTTEEATEVLLSGSRALEHLARHGLVHAAISPEQILAVGDSIQLSAEGVRKAESASGAGPLQPRYLAPESSAGNTTTAAGIWSLGATIFETLTQKTFGEGSRGEVKPLPLGWVLDRCLELEPGARCKPEEVPALLRSGPPPLPKPPVEVSATPSAEEAKPQTAAVAAGAEVSSSAIAAGASDGTPAKAAPGAAALPNQTVNGAPSQNPALKPAIGSAAQARAKVFQQAELDAAAPPQNTVSGTGPAKAAAAAASAASLGTRASGASLAGTSRPSSSMGRVETPRTAASGLRGRDVLGGIGGSEVGSGARRRTLDLEPAFQRSRVWIYLAAGVVILLAILWGTRSRPVKTSNTAAAANSARSAAIPASTPGSAPAASGKAWPTRTLEPEKAGSAATPVAKTTPAPARAVAPPKATRADVNGPVWRVIVYTFNRQADAERKVHTLNAKHPHFEAQVFSPSGPSGPYLVTVGGRMTREDAVRFRSRALGAGMPRDSYIQNYK